MSTAAAMAIDKWETRCLALPVAGVPASALPGTFAEGRPGHPHEAIDIAAPGGTPVFAVDDGRLVKLFKRVSGGLRSACSRSRWAAE